jgi:hypothetical protein
VDRLIEKEPEKGKLSIPTQRLLEELREEHKRLSNHESVRGIKQPNELQRAVEEARWKMARDMAFSGALLGASIGGATGAMIRRRKKTQRSVQRKVPHR